MQTTITFVPAALGPLHGVRIVDLSRLVAGNMLSLQLAHFGADMVKVKPPGDDPLRGWRDGGHELHWKVYARNNRSIVLNRSQHHSAPEGGECPAEGAARDRTALLVVNKNCGKKQHHRTRASDARRSTLR
jgi:hypothetical protein